MSVSSCEFSSRFAQKWRNTREYLHWVNYSNSGIAEIGCVEVSSTKRAVTGMKQNIRPRVDSCERTLSPNLRTNLGTKEFV